MKRRETPPTANRVEWCGRLLYISMYEEKNRKKNESCLHNRTAVCAADIILYYAREMKRKRDYPTVEEEGHRIFFCIIIILYCRLYMCVYNKNIIIIIISPGFFSPSVISE